MGYAGVTFLHQPDGALANDLALREQLVREIRTFRPDAVLAVDPETLFYGDGGVNHADHRAAGIAAVDAVYPAARNAMAFPWLARDGLEPHVVRRLYLFWSNHPSAWVDVTATLDRKIAALRAHASQIRAPRAARARGSGSGRARRARRSACGAAEAFRVIVIEEDDEEGPTHETPPDTEGGDPRGRLIPARARPGPAEPGAWPAGPAVAIRPQSAASSAGRTRPQAFQIAAAPPRAGPGHPPAGPAPGRRPPGQPLVGGDLAPRVERRELPLPRPGADPHPVQARVADREREVARRRHPAVGEPAQAVEAEPERRQRLDDLAPLAVREQPPERIVLGQVR